LLEKKSFFLFRPRDTGKYTLIQTQLPQAQVYDLLDAEVFRALLSRPKILEEQITDPSRPIVIDEIQKLPLLLDGRIAIEVKATTLAQDKHLKGLRALKEEGLLERYFCITTDTARRTTDDGIEIWPWEDFLRALWSGEVL
jgi:predicted AAA+ superfamily ATPase